MVKIRMFAGEVHILAGQLLNFLQAMPDQSGDKTSWDESGGHSPWVNLGSTAAVTRSIDWMDTLILTSLLVFSWEYLNIY